MRALVHVCQFSMLTGTVVFSLLINKYVSRYQYDRTGARLIPDQIYKRPVVLGAPRPLTTSFTTAKIIPH